MVSHAQSVRLKRWIVYSNPAVKLLSRVTKRFEEQGRKDDNPETFSKRLEKYYEDTAPLVPIYAERGILVEVDGMGSIEAVATAIDAALKETA